MTRAKEFHVEQPSMTWTGHTRSGTLDCMVRDSLKAEGFRPTLTLFSGLPGAGKTTLARRLEREGRGIRLATDEWQDRLGIPHSDSDFHERLQAALYRHALILLRQGVDVILEDGLWMKAEQIEKFADARSCGALIDLHVFDVDQDTLWSRLQERNTDGNAGAVPITSEHLRAAWAIFQPVSADELSHADSYQTHTGGLA
ncbi:Signal recognition particle receptor FtsY [Frondihabitans sp. 762G35]|uniref:AAA family ATPase n=1 Tax=Frondihabitans sp. 762G35 TaxID=1446794 RepID=UPI000D217FF2|nr:ATP-binding protein [Frondihabitans sp. 762G35]ARC56169.1 Signal recognition particle receptor FtsY [Frondihabitans sp. 762G35]